VAERPIVVVLHNPKSGKAGVDDDSTIAAAIGDRHDVRVQTLGDDDDIPALARAAIESGARTVVAGGGDGTVSAVASALIGTDVALGILPLGTSNSIADALGLPLALAAAGEVIATGHRRTIDTARIGDTAMLLMATIGLHARAITEATPEAKARLGVIAYVGKALEVLRDQEPFAVTLELDDGATVRLVAHAVTVANLVPPRSVLAQGPPTVEPDDGLLDVTVVAFSGTFDALATSVHLYTHALAGLPAERENVAFFRASRLTISADPVQPLMVDGEHVGTSPFTIECRPKSLDVLVP